MMNSTSRVCEDVFFVCDDIGQISRGIKIASNDKYYDISDFRFLTADGKFKCFEEGEGFWVAESRESAVSKDPSYAYAWKWRKIVIRQ